MAVTHHKNFSFTGFYDSGPHVTIFPGDRPFEVIAHETCHAIITTLSGCGYLQQLAAFLKHCGVLFNCPAAVGRAGQINIILEKSSLLVHEATAWFVSELARNHDRQLGLMPRGATANVDGPVDVPRAYKTYVERLRQCIESVPNSPFPNIDQCLDDHDPVFLTPSSLAIAMAAFALSPPQLREIVDRSSNSLERELEASLQSTLGNPVHRLERVVDWLKLTDFNEVMQWSKWVWRWQYGKEEPCPISMANLNLPKPTSHEDHSAYLRYEIVSERLIQFLSKMSNGEISPSDLRTVDWATLAERYRFEPHVVSHFQTCIIPYPRPIQDLNLQGPQRTSKFEAGQRYVNVTLGEESNFQFARFPGQEVMLRFGPGVASREYVWTTGCKFASEYLNRWSAAGKGIVTASIDYDFGICDNNNEKLFVNVPHVVVANTDLRSLWLRFTDQARGGFQGSAQFEVAFVSSKEAPDLYGFLIFKSVRRSPLVVIPVLVRSGQSVGSIIEELRTPGYRLTQVASDQIERFVGVCESSLQAAFYFLRHSFSQEGTDQPTRISDLTIRAILGARSLKASIAKLTKALRGSG